MELQGLRAELIEGGYELCKEAKGKLDDFSALYYTCDEESDKFIDELYDRYNSINNRMIAHQYDNIVPDMVYFGTAVVELFNKVKKEESK